MRQVVFASFLFLLSLLSLPSGLGATVYGNIYDLSLEKARGASVEVNTTPNQYMVASDGRYSFEIPRGAYLITARMEEDGEASLESRMVTVDKDGSYVLDFILFPQIEDEENVDIDLGDVAGDASGNGLWIVTLIITAMIAGVVWLWLRGRRKERQAENVHADHRRQASQEVDGDLLKVISIIKGQGGRATQKDIRKEIPLSEAKISLMLSELEHKGFIEKIKKGRGNIIVLKK